MTRLWWLGISKREQRWVSFCLDAHIVYLEGIRGYTPENEKWELDNDISYLKILADKWGRRPPGNAP